MKKEEKDVKFIWHPFYAHFWTHFLIFQKVACDTSFERYLQNDNDVTWKKMKKTSHSFFLTVFRSFETHLCPFLDPLSHLFKKWHVTPRLKDIFKVKTMVHERRWKRQRQIHFFTIFRSSGTHFMPIFGPTS